jgi:hypothetical protein
MTTEINKYHTSKIYKISSHQCEKFYIGSTTATLNRRLSQHKKDYKRYIEKGIGNCMTSFEIVKFDDAIIELIKDVNCENRKQLERVEGECIKEHHDRILNRYVAGRTKKEYNEAHKDIKKEKDKQYREAHKNEIKDKNKQYKEAHKNEIKDKTKQYKEAHKNELKDKQKEYCERNKEKLHEKFDCDCGGKYIFQNKTTHVKSQKHQLYISNQP